MARRTPDAYEAGIMLAVAVGAVLGAVFGQPGTGQASSSENPPRILCRPSRGLQRSATPWSQPAERGKGSPTSFHFAWSRCDTTGAACLAISGATAKIYTVTSSDQIHTLRVAVAAKNSSGQTTATSNATSLVPASGCPGGSGAIPAANVVPPRRLEITAASVSPAVTRRTKTLHLHVKITACGGRPVQGAIIYGAAIPFNQFGVGQAPTGSDGTVTLAEGRRAGFPASRHQQLLTLFVRVTKAGGEHRSHRCVCQSRGRVPLRTLLGGMNKAAPCRARRGAPLSSGAGEKLVHLGRPQAALRTRSLRDAQRLEQPRDERNPVSQQRERQAPGGEW